MIKKNEPINSSIPQKYICYYSKKVMEDPVLVLESNIVCDRRNLPSYNDNNIYSLYDLKEEIKEYSNQQARKNFNSQNLKNNENSCTVKSKNNGVKKEQNELFDSTLQFQTRQTEVLNQNSVVNEKNVQAKKGAKNLATEVQELKKNRENFAEICKEFEKIKIGNSSTEIFDKTEKLLKSSQNLQIFITKISDTAKKFGVKKQELEEQLSNLQQKEYDLVEMRENQQKVYTKFGIKAEFCDDVDALSKQYNHPKQIDQTELLKLFAAGEVCNVSVNLQTELQITVSSVVHIQNLHIQKSNNHKNNNYLHIHIQNWDAHVTLQECQFENIGLKITSEGAHENSWGNTQEEYKAVLKNISVKNAPENGVFVQSLTSCSMDQVNVSGAKANGVYLETLGKELLREVSVSNSYQIGMYINYCDSCNIQKSKTQDTKQQGIYFYGSQNTIVEETQILDCQDSGIYFSISCGEMRNCSVRNCNNYGVNVYNYNSTRKNTLTGRNVTFENNYPDNSYGNFIIT